LFPIVHSLVAHPHNKHSMAPYQSETTSITQRSEKKTDTLWPSQGELKQLFKSTAPEGQKIDFVFDYRREKFISAKGEGFAEMAKSEPATAVAPNGNCVVAFEHLITPDKFELIAKQLDLTANTNLAARFSAAHEGRHCFHGKPGVNINPVFAELEADAYSIEQLLNIASRKSPKDRVEMQADLRKLADDFAKSGLGPNEHAILYLRGMFMKQILSEANESKKLDSSSLNASFKRMMSSFEYVDPDASKKIDRAIITNDKTELRLLAAQMVAKSL
jgi:hypothetical protein